MNDKYSNIKYLISENRLQEAIDQLLVKLHKVEQLDLHNKVVAISGRLRSLKNDMHKGTIDSAVGYQNENQIRDALIRILEESSYPSFSRQPFPEIVTPDINGLFQQHFYQFFRLITNSPEYVAQIYDFFNKAKEELRNLNDQTIAYKTELSTVKQHLKSLKEEEAHLKTQITYNRKKLKENKVDLQKSEKDHEQLIELIATNRQVLNETEESLSEKVLLLKQKSQAYQELEDQFFQSRKSLEDFEAKNDQVKRESLELEKQKIKAEEKMVAFKEEMLQIQNSIEAEKEKLRQQKLIYQKNASEVEDLKTKETIALEKFFSQMRQKKVEYDQELIKEKERHEMQLNLLKEAESNKSIVLARMEEELDLFIGEREKVRRDLSELTKKYELQEETYNATKKEHRRKIDLVSKAEYELSLKRKELDQILEDIKSQRAGSSTKSDEQKLWDMAIKNDTYLDYLEYINRYPDGQYIDTARIEFYRKKREIDERQ